MGSTRREFLKQSSALALGASSGLIWPACTNASPALPATEFGGYDGMGMAELVRTGQVSPLELVEDTLRRVEQVNPRLTAVLTGLFDTEKARERAAGPLGDGPLSGVPVMIKNLVAYEEATITSGSRLFVRLEELGLRPGRETSSLVDAMESSGMVVTGITNSPEMGLIDSTEPVAHGPTRNPWRLSHSPGGSSGGTGAAVAAGIVPLAHGNDGGGSIRIPASHCGVFGLKPTRARELGNDPSGDGLLSIASNLCLSRSVRDTAAFLGVVERGDNPGLPRVGMVDGPSVRRLRVALMTDTFSGTANHPEVEEAVQAAARLCEELGHDVTVVPLPIGGSEFIDTFIGFWAAGTLGYEALAKELLGADTDLEEVLESWTLGLMDLARSRGPEACVERAREVFPRVNRQMAGLFESYDVMVSPVLRIPPFEIGSHDPMGDFDTVFERVLDTVEYTPLQNAAGMPGMSVPLHWTGDDLPVGVQFSSWRGGDRMLLELAYELEEARPWAGRRPPVFASPEGDVGQ